MIAGGGSLLDPYVLGFSSTATRINANVTGKGVHDPRLIPGEKTGVLVCVGQSNIANVIDANYTISNPSKVSNLNVVDGGVYAASDPMLGCSSFGGSWLGRLADKLINTGTFDRVILVPIARGGSVVADWATGPLALNLKTAVARCQAQGYTISGFLWQQGENDTQAGTGQSAYYNALMAVIANSRAAGSNAPWFVGKSTYIYGSISTAIQAACDAAVNGVDVFAGANCDTLNSTYRQADNLHFNASTGADAVATRWQTAVSAVL